MLPLIPLGTLFVLMLLRVVVPIGLRIEGQLLERVPLSFRERLLLQRNSIYAIGAVLLLGAVGGWLSTILELMAILGAFVILMIPAEYVLTSEGIGLNHTVFRRWEEFREYRHQGVKLELLPRDGERSFTLYIPTRSQGQVIKILKRHLK